MTTQTTSVERLVHLVNLFSKQLDILSLDAEQSKTRVTTYIKSLAPTLDADATLFAKNLIDESSYWFRPDWTPELFTAETKDMDDAERCRVVLLTRDIPLISWFVNARAGRNCKPYILKAELESQCKINESEVEEIREGIEAMNSDMFLDAISDTLLTTCGFTGYLPIAITQNFVEMVDANFTRIAGNMEEAQATQRHWESMGVPCYIKETEMGTFPVLVSNDIVIGTGEGTVKYPANKFLKKVGFRDAVPCETIAMYENEDHVPANISQAAGTPV